MKTENPPASLVWRQIDLDAIAHNLKTLRALTKAHTAVMAVVKADAYGHGAVRVAKKALESGVTHLGVARLHEALELRNAGINAPILVFGYIPESDVDTLIALEVSPTVFDLETACMLSERAVAKGTHIKIHLKVDTGMGRLGILPDSRRPSSEKKGALAEVLTISALPGLKIEGIYTHFAAADTLDKGYAEYQHQTFMAFIEGLKHLGIEIPLVHSANSAALIDLPEAHFNMVRAGIAMYGLAPSGEVDIRSLDLRPAMEIHSIITSVKKVPKSFKVSYGMTYETEKETVIAAVPIGYADGFSRLFSSRGEMIVRGRKAPIAGRVCMDQTLIDVGEIPGVKPGDEVVILGTQANQRITADEMAETIGTINYEVISSLTARVPKIYSE
ncbi:Alr [Desulforapulum autotrophicum HRM2]|uniref:Alanine racemase n=1 Tax=Desulforapulum autotrophicum (strain ATCC 43914 / DSM 3382 / VKM B-1955 / HRM2) TaxID=177437 RepID=C0QHN9_DESAH|nr:alanine racemase [Desulforapulum autotrophicum]ACN13597.1 Alr [Desulforapulum autotrophicum HRM2]